MYVDAMFNRTQDVIHVVERVDGKREFKDYPAKYTFYYKDPAGKYKSAFGDPLSRIVCKSTREFKSEQRMNAGGVTFESDINPLNQCLSENYFGAESPNLNVAFWDIETDFEPYKYPLTRKVQVRKKADHNDLHEMTIRSLLKMSNAFRYEVYDHVSKKWVNIKNSRYTELGRGFSSPEEAFLPITAITVYLQWIDALVTLAMPPDTLTMEEAYKECAEWGETTLLFPKTEEGEKDMLDAFFNLIEDADVLSGWNCSGFDIPYTVNRVQRLMGKAETRRFCLWNQLPKKREYEKFGKKQITYDLKGRLNIDYLELYQKYTFEERHSYSLDAIGEYEVDERKVPYEGTLDQLYNEDFQKFIAYNRQDVALLGKIDDKLKFIDQSNMMAHMNTVTIPTTMGSVGVIDQAIINEAHVNRDLKVQNKRHGEKNNKAAGAYVAYPKKGFHHWVGSMDLNSLYPSIIRALNMSPETIMGQIRLDLTEEMIETKMRLEKKSFAACWEGVFATLEYDAVMRKDASTMLTVDWEDGRTDVLSGAQIYKMVFEQRNPIMLSANGTFFTTEFEGIIPGLLDRWYKQRLEQKAKMKAAEKEGDTKGAEFWDMQQRLTKVALNSIYGSLLNVGSRFFDERMGQSTTLTGRQIVKHMSAEVNKIITGDYDHQGVAVIYGDSVAADTLIQTSDGEMTVEELFKSMNNGLTDVTDQKEYATPKDDSPQVLGYASDLDEAIYGKMAYVMRHKTRKEKWEIGTEHDHRVVVTGDHSIIVDRKGQIIDCKPEDILDSDLLIVHKNGKEVDHLVIKYVGMIGHFDDEYVYDISIADQEPYFFANGILVHNTDSCDKDSFIRTTDGTLTVDELFKKGQVFWNEGDKQYSRNNDIKISHYSDDNLTSTCYNYVYRHKVSKGRFKITTSNGKEVIVTEDHSVMVEDENGNLLEKKPTELTEGDVVITIKTDEDFDSRV